jgi:hypothetical protein
MIKYLVSWNDWDSRKLKCNVPNLDQLFPLFCKKCKCLEIQLECFFFKGHKSSGNSSIFDIYFAHFNLFISDILLLQKSPSKVFPLFRISFELIPQPFWECSKSRVGSWKGAFSRHPHLYSCDHLNLYFLNKTYSK